MWELRNGSISRHLEDAPERFHGRPDGLNGTDDNENESGGGAGGKVVLWLFILGLAGGLFYIGYKKPEVVAKAKAKMFGGSSGGGSSAPPVISGPTGVKKISGPTGVRKLSGPASPPPVPSRKNTPPKIEIKVEKSPVPPRIPPHPNMQVALS